MIALLSATMLFSQEYRACARTDKEWGYINNTGVYVVNPQFEYAWDFHDGLAWVRKGGQWGLIDRQGNYVINPQFPNAMDFVRVE
jgi:hypothetical protein